MKAQKGSGGGIAVLFNFGVRSRWVVSATPQLLYTPGITQYSLCRRLGGTQGWSGQVLKISPSPGFNPQTVQPVVSCSTK